MARLDRYVSESGLSRAQAREAIAQGRVSVAGLVARDAGQQVPDGAPVCLDGAPVRQAGPTHLALYKPSGVVTAQSDGRFSTVFDLLPPKYRARDLSAVGRLDRDTTGLLLFTTDGQLAHRLISPKWAIEKVYLATVETPLTEAIVRRMAEGVPLKDFTALPAKLRIINPLLGEITVTEGKYHQVKRMFGALGCPVTALHRKSVGGLLLDDAMNPGDVRPLTQGESARLYALTHLKED
ncbi:MAG: pseudouridine synthase [Clostridia bacterium]